MATGVNSTATGRSRLGDHKLRPTVMLLTSQPGSSREGQGVLAVVIAVASTLAFATMLQYIIGAS
jgi:hypothetical protein